MRTLNKEDWQLFGRWVQPTLSGAFWSRWLEAGTVEEIFPGIPQQPILFLDGYTFFPQTAVDYYSNLVEKLFADNDFTSVTTRIDKIGRRCEEQNQKLLEESPAERALYIEKLFSAYTAMIGPWISVIMFSNSLEAHVLKNKLVANEQEMVEKVKPYWRATWLEEQAADTKKLAQKLVQAVPAVIETGVSRKDIESTPEVSEQFKAHLERFDWFGTHHWAGEAYSEEKALLDLTSTIQKRSYDESKDVTRDLADERSNLWKLLAACIYWRTHAAEVTAMTVFRSRPVLTEVAKQWNLSYGELTRLSSREISAALATDANSIALPDDFDERKNAYGANINSDNKEQIITGDTLKQRISEVVATVDTDVTEIKGSVASKGSVVTGIVKVLIQPEDVHKFEPGDILVAPETAPDYVPAMKKAAAVVTEVGGITSHAAIVSRELGVPCIIGTKIATQVLKDGMEVEVNTDSGIIKILN